MSKHRVSSSVSSVSSTVDQGGQMSKHQIRRFDDYLVREGHMEVFFTLPEGDWDDWHQCIETHKTATCYWNWDVVQLPFYGELLAFMRL